MPRTATWHLPLWDADTKPYWDAAREGKLLLRFCAACDRAFHYPRPFCPRCWSRDLSWREASGDGVVYTFTIVRQNDLPPFNERVPYVIAIVDLAEGVRMTSNIEGCSPEDVRCGMPVRVGFRTEMRDDDPVALPVFTPV